MLPRASVDGHVRRRVERLGTLMPPPTALAGRTGNKVRRRSGRRPSPSPVQGAVVVTLRNASKALPPQRSRLSGMVFAPALAR